MIPDAVRVWKHALFGLAPGHLGMRNRACYRVLTREDAEPAFEAALAEAPKEAVCIDCGANVGAVTRRLAGHAAKVYAFEPDQWSFMQLADAVGDLENVECINKAVGAADGVLTMYRAGDFDADPTLHSLATSALPRANREGQVGFEVDVVDLVRFIDALDTPVHLLKLDIEGVEVDVLEALLDSPAAAKVRYAFVETHELQFPELLERTEALRQRTAGLAHPRVNLDWH